MFIFNVKTQKSIKPSVLIVSVVALLVSIFISLLLTSNVMAAKMTTAALPSERAASYSYWKATSKCVSDHMHATITTKVGANGATSPSQGDENDFWFDNRDAWVTVYPNGKQDCAQVMAKALKLWGWGSPTQFLRDIGYTFDSSVPEWVQANGSNDGKERLEGFKAAVLSKVGNVVDLLDNSAKYVLYTGMFNSKSANLSECSAKQIGKLSEVDVTQRNAANKNESRGGVTYTIIKVVEGSTPTNYVYTYTPIGESTLTAYASAWNYRGSNYPGGTGEHFTCEDLVSKINSNANAFGLWNRQHPTETDDVTPSTSTGDDCSTTNTCDEPVSSCAIESLGWILCPVINLLAMVADQSFNFLSDNFLRTDPKVFSTDNETYKAWAVVRNIANILFVIAFLFIVFSQLTGVGISNYGVKKMLPRIVVAAILVNVSYFISQLAIDLSNILGFSIRGVFDTVIAEVTASSSGGEAGSMAWLKGGGNGFVDLAGGIIGGTLAIGAVYLMLSAFGPILIAAVLALVLILFILVARQAIIILLVVLSPLALVAFLLPNTEQYFKQWRKILTAMLMLFPIIALVYGASELAANLLGRSFSGVGGADNNMFGQIISAAVLILPLFAVPMLLKKSLDGVPMAGQMANKWASKGFGNVGNKLRDSNRGSVMARGAAIRKQGRENYRSKRFAEKITGSGPLGAVNRAIAGGIRVPLDKAGKASRDSLQKVATAATYKAQVEEVEDAKKLIENENLSGTERQTLAMTGRVSKNGKVIDGEVAQKAAIQMQLGGAGSMGDVHKIVNASSGSLSKFKQTIGQGALSSSGKDPALSGKSIDDITQGEFKYDEAVKLAFSQGKYTAESVATMHDGARAEALRVAQTAQAKGDPSMMNKLQNAVKGIEASPELMAKLAGNDVFGGQVQTIKGSGGSGSETPPPSTTPTGGGTPAPTGSTPMPTAASSATPVPIDPEWQDWHRGQQTDKTVINVDHTGSANVAVPPQPQSARESQEQAKAVVIARARQQAASAGQQNGHTTDSSGFQTPPSASDDYRDKMSK